MKLAWVTHQIYAPHVKNVSFNTRTNMALRVFKETCMTCVLLWLQGTVGRLGSTFRVVPCQRGNASFVVLSHPGKPRLCQQLQLLPFEATVDVLSLCALEERVR